MANNCSDTTKLSRRVMACAPPCCQPISCIVETKACHASQHKNGFRQNTRDENGNPLPQPFKYYLRSTKSLTWQQSCRSGVSWYCWRGLQISVCRFGISSDSSGNVNATHTLEKFDGGRAGCESGSVSGRGSSTAKGKEGNVTGGGYYDLPCLYKSWQSGSSSDSASNWAFGEKMTENGPVVIITRSNESTTVESDTGCYHPFIGESGFQSVIDSHNFTISEPNSKTECSADVEVTSWRNCPTAEYPDRTECSAANYTVKSNKCHSSSIEEIVIAAISGNGHFSLGHETIKPGTKASVTAAVYSNQLSSCADGIDSPGKNQSTGEGNNNRQGPWSPSEIPDGDGSSTSGYGGSGESGSGQSPDGQSEVPGWSNNPFPPLQGAQNDPASTQSATQQTPQTKPLPPVSQHPPNLYDAYINGSRPTYPIHGGSSPTSGGNSQSWTGTWGSTVDGSTWWYQQGTNASGSSYAEGSYYIGPGSWGYQFTEW